MLSKRIQESKQKAQNKSKTYTIQQVSYREEKKFEKPLQLLSVFDLVCEDHLNKQAQQTRLLALTSGMEELNFHYPVVLLLPCYKNFPNLSTTTLNGCSTALMLALFTFSRHQSSPENVHKTASKYQFFDHLSLLRYTKNRHPLCSHVLC